jgi:hypothetical protein
LVRESEWKDSGPGTSGRSEKDEPLILKPGEPFVCEVSLAIPEGSPNPTFVVAHLQPSTGKRKWDSTQSFKFGRKTEDGRYLLICERNAPEDAGRYQVWVEAVYAALSWADTTPDGSPKPLEKRYRSSSLPLEVEP